MKTKDIISLLIWITLGAFLLHYLKEGGFFAGFFTGMILCIVDGWIRMLFDRYY